MLGLLVISCKTAMLAAFVVINTLFYIIQNKELFFFSAILGAFITCVIIFIFLLLLIVDIFGDVD